MTSEQHEHWKDFALRMARTCYAAHRRPSCEWILDRVESYFEWFGPDDVAVIRDWDHSDDYPEKHGREYHLSWCGCNGFRHAHNGEPRHDCSECHGSGLHHALFSGPLVCDTVAELLDDESPSFYFDDDERAENEARELAAYEQWDEQWGGPVCCCIRAGLDMACSPSMGVMGFTAGDIRRMYPEGVPEWIFKPDEKLVYSFTDPVVENGTFAELPDSAGVLL